MNNLEKILIPKSFQVQNIVVDKILQYLNGSETKILLVLIRQTLGWNKYEEKISVTTFMKYTGLSNRKVIDALHFLMKINLAIKTMSTSKGDIYKLNLDWTDESINNLIKLRPKKQKTQTGEESSPVKKVHQTGEESSPLSGEESSHIERHSFKPTLLNQFIINNNCPNCKSKIRIKNKKKGSYQQVLYCENCNCEFLPLTETEIKILIKGTDFEAIECYEKYLELHPNSETLIYDKAMALKIFQNILNRCRSNGKDIDAKDIVLERIENYFDNEFYEKVNWSIETFSKNFNSFINKTPVYKPNYIN